MRRSEIMDKIRVLRRRLDEMRQYKQVIAEDGLEPDQDDKVLESELIVKLLRLEKQLAALEGRPLKSAPAGKRPGGKKPGAGGKAPKPRTAGKSGNFGKRAGGKQRGR